MDIKVKRKLRKFIKELEGIRGRHTELVSVYVPAGYELIKIIQHLQQEQGTASNIKDARTRKNVIDSLERMIRHLRLFKATPPNGLAVFSGNASDNESKIDLKIWSIEPPEPMNFRLYRCDQTFMLDPLKNMIETQETFGLLVVDRREATIGLLKGNSIQTVAHLTSAVPGKTRAGGQCCHYNTVIQSNDGEILKIEKSHNPYILKSADFNNFSLKNSPITDKWYVKKDVVYEIITKFPQLKIKTSKDHVFFVIDEMGIIEKTAEELRKKDKLIMPEKIEIEGREQNLSPNEFYSSFIINKEGRDLLIKKRKEKNLFQKELAKKINLTQTAISFVEIGKRRINRSFLRNLCFELEIDFKKFLEKYAEPYKQYGTIILPKKLDPIFAQFLGYLTGDGCVEKDRITFFEQRNELALHYKQKFDNYFNINSSYKFRENKNYYQIRFTSRPLVRMIRKNFYQVKKTLNSEIPDKILRSKNDVVAGFLKGIFDAEGYISIGNISIACTNKFLIQQLQLLLLRFSIISSFLKRNIAKNLYSNKPQYALQISEKRSLELFKKCIGFSAEDKSEKLKIIINKKSDKSSVRQILVSGKKIRKIIEQAGYNKQMFPKVSGFFIDKRMISRSVFKNSILKHVKDKELYKQLEEIYNIPFLPVKISKINKTKEETDMIDISVKNQNFIANGLIVHNSAARFSRIREEMAKEFFNRIADTANKQFLGMENLKGILIGGPGPTKEEFVDGDYLNNEVKKKIITVEDLSYTSEEGLHELVNKSKDALAKEEIMEEKQIMQRFFDSLRKEPEKVAYGKAEVENALKMGAVDKLLLSDSLDDDEIERLEEEAENTSSELHLISTETREGSQLKDLGGYAAILRYALQ